MRRKDRAAGSSKMDQNKDRVWITSLIPQAWQGMLRSAEVYLAMTPVVSAHHSASAHQFQGLSQAQEEASLLLLHWDPLSMAPLLFLSVAFTVSEGYETSHRKDMVLLAK